MVRTFDWLELGTPVVYESYDDLQVMSAASPDGLTCLLVFWPDHWSDFSCTPDESHPRRRLRRVSRLADPPR